MTLIGSTVDAAHAAYRAAQQRLTDARAAVRDREKDVDQAARALPPPVDLVLQDPVLAAAAAPDDVERQLLVRLHEVERLHDEAYRVWHREGLRVCEEQRRGGGLPLDEDAGFVAADKLLGEYKVELIEIRKRLDLGQRIRIFNASVGRHDEWIREQETVGVLGQISTDMRADIRRRIDETRADDGQKARIDRMIAQSMGRAE